MRRIPAKSVAVRTDAEGGFETVATFHLEGDRVVAEWTNERYRSEVEGDGIRAVIDGRACRLRPSDGPSFYDALEMAYWRSSMVVVRTTTIDVEDV
jgi:hypothetical protein